jgi:DNA replication protein DnaC
MTTEEMTEEQRGIIERFMAKAAAMPKDAPPAEPSKPAPNAVQVRLGWYIPPRHVNDTFATFKPQSTSQETALKAAMEWVESVKRGDGGALALIGGVGTGKSHLLYAAIRAVNEAGIHGAAAGWYDLADLFRQAKFGHDEDVTEARVKKGRILGAAALGIDEIRPTSGTEYDTTELSQLMTRSYREKQGVFVTSNYADEKLTKIVGMAATSRLTQITVVGPDMRQPEHRHLKVAR